MDTNINIDKGNHWFRNHLLHSFLILFLLTIGFFLLLDNLFLCSNLNKVVDENTPVINLIIEVAGIGSAIIVYNDYLAQKQHEAVFGFYFNMRVFLKRLSVFLGDNFSEAEIFVKLYTKEAFDKYSDTAPTPELINAFYTLCLEFINFLSNSKDNVPARRDNEKFVKWYESQISIVELLQKGVLFTSQSYGDYSDKIELENFYNKIKKDIAYIENIIKEKVEEDSML